MHYRVAHLLWMTAATAAAILIITRFIADPTVGALSAPVKEAAAAEASHDEAPFAALRSKGKFARTGMTPTEADDVGYELTRHSFGLKVMHTVGVDDAVVRGFGAFLGERQLAWQQRGRKRGVDEGKLLTALNRHLELDGSAEYLKIRHRELRRMRFEVWTRLPELSTGVDRNQAQADKRTRLFDQWMSPFEAYLVSDLLLYQKVSNEEYLRTDAEEARRGERPTTPKKPGWYVVPPNPRGMEFQQHMDSLAQKKWHTVDAVKQTVNDILDEAEQ